MVAIHLNRKGRGDDTPVVARDKEELERLSAGLLVRLSALVPGNVGLSEEGGDGPRSGWDGGG